MGQRKSLLPSDAAEHLSHAVKLRLQSSQTFSKTEYIYTYSLCKSLDVALQSIGSKSSQPVDYDWVIPASVAVCLGRGFALFLFMLWIWKGDDDPVQKKKGTFMSKANMNHSQVHIFSDWR